MRLTAMRIWGIDELEKVIAAWLEYVPGASEREFCATLSVTIPEELVGVPVSAPFTGVT